MTPYTNVKVDCVQRLQTQQETVLHGSAPKSIVNWVFSTITLDSQLACVVMGYHPSALTGLLRFGTERGTWPVLGCPRLPRFAAALL